MGIRAWIVRNIIRVQLIEPLEPKTPIERRMDVLEQTYKTDVALLQKNMHRVLSTVARDEKRMEALYSGSDEGAEDEEPDNEYVQILKQVGIDTPEKLEAAIAKIKSSGGLPAGINEDDFL